MVYIFTNKISTRNFTSQLLLIIIQALDFFKKLILEREEERERNIDLLFHLFMRSLVDPYMCPDWELNLQP